MTGSVYRRLDEFIALVNPQQAVHVDAWRCINFSWEKNGDFYGLDDEMICGCEPEFAYLRDKGIVPGIEGLNSSPMTLPLLSDYVWHWVCTHKQALVCRIDYVTTIADGVIQRSLTILRLL